MLLDSLNGWKDVISFTGGDAELCKAGLTKKVLDKFNTFSN